MRKIIRKKHGQVQYLLENTFRVGFLLVALLIFFLMINYYINNKIDTKELKVEILTNKILYSDIIMYEDENDQVYPGIIDMKKFTDDNINSRINYQVKRHSTAMLEILDNEENKVVKTIYLNKAQYTNLEVLLKQEGKGGSSSYYKTFPVTYYDSGIYKYATLQMTIIVPNS
jgi:hypothetical protein